MARGDRWRRQEHWSRTPRQDHRHAGRTPALGRPRGHSRVAVPPRAAPPLSATPRGTGHARRIESRGRAPAPHAAAQTCLAQFSRAGGWRPRPVGRVVWPCPCGNALRPARAQPAAAQNRRQRRQRQAGTGQRRRATRPRGSRGPARPAGRPRACAVPVCVRARARSALPPRADAARTETEQGCSFPCVQSPKQRTTDARGAEHVLHEKGGKPSLGRQGQAHSHTRTDGHTHTQPPTKSEQQSTEQVHALLHEHYQPTISWF
jgi:hypothetical protein